MNTDQITGQWKQLAGKIRYQWRRFTDADLERAAKAAANTLQARFSGATALPRGWPRRRSGIFVRGI